jgi:tyrosine-protein phosphatase non-receptor type 9
MYFRRLIITYFINKKAVDEFLQRQNWPSSDAKNWNIAVKFLMARKFDVDRAIQLYTAHDTLRRKENLHLIDINDAEFLNDLETGKFTILVNWSSFFFCFIIIIIINQN